MIHKKITYVNEDGFEFTFEPIEETLKIKKTKKGFEARYLTPDLDPRSPDEDKDVGLFLVGYHNDFFVDRADVLTKQQCVNLFTYPKELEEDDVAWVRDFKKQYHIFGLEAYIHSGVSLALSHEGNFPDRQWDVSQLGAIFASKKEWKNRRKAKKSVLSLISSWNQYLSGDVYAIVKDTYDEKKLVNNDAVWGYYGKEEAEEGLKVELNNTYHYIQKKIKK